MTKKWAEPMTDREKQLNREATEFLKKHGLNWGGRKPDPKSTRKPGPGRIIYHQNGGNSN
ncbi:MAG: hypothetical protein U0792_05465 [Gemmataceae bacterium]